MMKQTLTTLFVFGLAALMSVVACGGTETIAEDEAVDALRESPVNGDPLPELDPGTIYTPVLDGDGDGSGGLGEVEGPDASKVSCEEGYVPVKNSDACCTKTTVKDNKPQTTFVCEVGGSQECTTDVTAGTGPVCNDDPHPGRIF